MKIGNIVWLALLCACAAKEPAPSPPPASVPEIPPALQSIWHDPEQLLATARQADADGEPETAVAALERVLEAFPKSPAYLPARQFLAELRLRRGLTPYKIGVLLPLTGPYAPFGQTVLQGIVCAAGLFDPCPAPPVPLQLAVKDTQGRPERARAAFLELAETEKIAAVVGPLLSQTAEAIAPLVQQKNIPTILLSPQPIADGGAFLFQHSLHPAQEVAALVTQAARSRLNRFILFYPENNYGREYAALFKEQWKGKIIKETGFSPDLPDFSGVLAQLLTGLSSSSDPIGLFIPDSFRRVVKIAEALDALNISNLKLFGTSRWYHPKLLLQPFVSLEGAILETPFYPEAPYPATQQFRSDFVQALARSPTWMEAIGFDAVQLLIQAMAPPGRPEPAALREALAAKENYPAVVGPLSWSPEGIAQWPLYLLTIHHGAFVPVDTPAGIGEQQEDERDAMDTDDREEIF